MKITRSGPPAFLFSTLLALATMANAKDAILLSDLTEQDFDYIGYTVFGLPPFVKDVKTGNQFADKRTNEENLAKFMASSTERFGSYTPDNLVLKIADLPFELGKYDFDLSVYELCVPGFWFIARGPDKELRFLGETSSKGRCQKKSPTQMSIGSQVQRQSYGPAVYLRMPSHSSAEALFNKVSEHDLSGDVYCGAPFTVRRGTFAGSWTFMCQITRIDLQISGSPAIEYRSDGKTSSTRILTPFD